MIKRTPMSYDTNESYTFSPLLVHLHIGRLSKARREARMEWLQTRDALSIQENAEYLDSHKESGEVLRELREELNGYEPLVTAQLN